MKKRIFASLLVLASAVSLFAGCTKTPSTSSQGSSSSSQVSTPATDGKITYPLVTKEVLSYWVPLNNTVAGEYTTLAETPFYKNLEELSGVKVDYQHPPAGQDAEQFNLLIASSNLPDIIEFDWLKRYPGGAEKAILDKIALPLNDFMEADAPDLKAYLDANPGVNKQIQTDAGNYYAFPFIRGDIQLCSSFGSMIRQDWLDELKLERPETPEQWTTVLTAFKEKKNAAAPYSYDYSANKDNDPVMLGLGTTNSFQLDNNGKMVYGATTPEYKEYLKLMAQWYKAGLLDPDYATVAREQLDAKVLNGDTGITAAWVGSGMGNFIRNGRVDNPEFNLTALKNPTTSGGVPEFGYMDNLYQGQGTAVVTTNAKNPQLAMQYLNFGYSEAGHIAFNFGKEGVSFTMVGDYPTYTELIMKTEGKSIAQMMSGNIRGSYNGPFVQDIRYQEQYFELPNQKEAYQFWSSTNMAKHKIPPITPTPEESDEFAIIKTNIDTYRDEMTLMIILGIESIDKFDAFVTELENMNLARALEIQTAALDRFNTRN